VLKLPYLSKLFISFYKLNSNYEFKSIYTLETLYTLELSTH